MKSYKTMTSHAEVPSFVSIRNNIIANSGANSKSREDFIEVNSRKVFKSFYTSLSLSNLVFCANGWLELGSEFSPWQ